VPVALLLSGPAERLGAALPAATKVTEVKRIVKVEKRVQVVPVQRTAYTPRPDVYAPARQAPARRTSPSRPAPSRRSTQPQKTAPHRTATPDPAPAPEAPAASTSPAPAPAAAE
jgi:hypothetical protein